MKTIRSWMTPNPILVKELRSRMRGSRAFITLTIVLVIMAAMMIGLVTLMTSIGNNGGSLLSPQIGQVLFQGLIIFEMIMVCTVTPAVTAGAISTEREKLTFEMLLATPLGSAKLLWGKLISALSYVFLLIFAAVPLASLVFLFGGVALLDLLKALFVLVAVAITFGVYGLFLSALFGRTGRATVVSFISVMVLLIGPLAGIIIGGIFGNQANLPRGLLALSPISMLVSAISTPGSVNGGGFGGLFGFLGGQWDSNLNPIGLTQIPRPIYHYSLAIFGALTIVLFILTMALVSPSRRFYLSRRTALTGGGILVVFLALIGAAFLTTAPRYEWVLSSINPTATPVLRGPLPAVVQAYPAPQVQLVTPSPTPVLPPGVVDLAEPTPTPVTPPGFGYPAGPTPTVITAQGAAMSEEDQIAIYATAARQVYQKDNTLNTVNPNFPVVYLITTTNDRTGDPSQPDAGPATISASLQNGIAAALSDLPARIVWVGSLNFVPKDTQTGMVQEGGLAITFGNIQFQLDGSVQLPASAFVSPMIGGGQTYRLEKTNGKWEVIGNTGTQWIS